MSRLAWLVIVVSACGGSEDSAPGDAPAGDAPNADASTDPDAAPGVGEPAELAGITLAHNQIRAMVATTPALPPLVWDDALAATAATYLARCVDDNHDGLVDHNADRGAGHAFSVGENIAASTGTASAMGAVKAWGDERASYHLDSNTCDTGKDCGHYTQVVWRASLQLGCAIRRCAGLMYPSTILCNYGPAGNVVGQKPY